MSTEADGQVHLDATALASLLEMVGDDPDFVSELADMYLSDSPVQLAAMRAAIEAGVPADLVRPAHTLKGNSANLGAAELAGVCRELEATARAGSLVDAPDRLAAAEAEYAAVVEALADARSRGWRLT